MRCAYDFIAQAPALQAKLAAKGLPPISWGVGVNTGPAPVRSELREAVELMPDHVREPLKDSGHVQDALDSLFEIQERLFRWRYPEWDDTEPDDFDYAT